MSGNTLPTLFYRNLNGDQWTRSHDNDPIPAGFNFGVYCNPFEVRQEHYNWRTGQRLITSSGTYNPQAVLKRVAEGDAVDVAIYKELGWL